jgi:hypothetical protein
MPKPYTMVSPFLITQTQLDQIIQDISQRYELVTSFATMWEQRIKLEYEYA